METKELKEEELTSVTGGDLEGSNNWYHGVYTCPLCGQEHEFVTKNYGHKSQTIDKYVACDKTDSILSFRFEPYVNDNEIEIFSKDHKIHRTTYHLDYFMGAGQKFILK